MIIIIIKFYETKVEAVDVWGLSFEEIKSDNLYIICFKECNFKI